MELVLGSDGQIGGRLVHALNARGLEVVGTSRREAASHFFDLSKQEQFVIPPGVRTAFIAAGVTSLAKCKNSPLETRELNVKKTCSLVRRLLDSGAFVVIFSTNLVYDGSNPLVSSCTSCAALSEYGRQKAELESLVAQSPRVGIVRLTKILSLENSLIKTWLAAWEDGGEILAFNDYPLAPISLDYATEAIVKISERELGGLWQVSAVDDIYYSEFAYSLAQTLGKNPENIKLVSARDYLPDGENIPKYSSLDVARIVEELGMSPKTALDVVRELSLPGARSGKR